MRLGMIGVGGMGGAMAGSVLRSGRELVVCDRDQDRVAHFVAAGATAAATPAELAAQVDVVAVVVVNDAQVLDVVHDAGDAPWIIHSTVSPETVLAVAERAPVVDAPVTGGEQGAAAGELAIMAGGDAALIDRVRPVMGPYASLVVRLGGLGAGQRTKLARNLVTYGEMVLADEVRSVIAAAEIDPAEFRKIVAHSDRTMPSHGGLLLEQRWLAGITTAIVHKDIRAALGVARQLGVDTPLADLVDERVDHAMRPEH